MYQVPVAFLSIFRCTIDEVLAVAVSCALASSHCVVVVAALAEHSWVGLTAKALAEAVRSEI